MKVLIEDIRNKFSQKGLKITPQRVIILEAIYKLKLLLHADQELGHALLVVNRIIKLGGTPVINPTEWTKVEYKTI
jgi:hypothetical protein